MPRLEFPNAPKVVLAKARKVALALPEAEESVTEMGSDFKVGRRIFAMVFSIEDPEGNTPTMLVCRADPEERTVLGRIGHPYFLVRSGKDRIGLVLNEQTDWTEVAELMTESYRIVAPKKLAAQLD